MRGRRIAALALACAGVMFGQASVGGARPGLNVSQVTGAAPSNNPVFTGTVDLSGAAHTLSAKTGTIAALPTTCTVGEQYFATDATAGTNKYYCTATNTWTQASVNAARVGGLAPVATSGSASDLSTGTLSLPTAAITANLFRGVRLAAPPAPVIALAGAGAGTLYAGGQYGYKITYLAGNGETDPSPLSSTVTTSSGNGQITVTLPIDPTGAATGRCIYRTWDMGNSIGGGYLHQVACVNDNSTTTYTDNIADSALTSQEPSRNSTGQVTQVIAQPGSEISYRSLQGYDPSSALIQAPVSVGKLNNIWVLSEGPFTYPYNALQLTRDTLPAVTWNGITLRNLTNNSANNAFYTGLFANLGAYGYTGFTAGQRYMLSYYILNASGREQFVWLGSLGNSGSNGHGSRLIDGQVRRVWRTFVATANNALDQSTSTTVAEGSSTGSTIIQFLQQGAPGFYAGDGTLNIYIGGVQIEAVANQTQGIGVLGDSTAQFCDGTTDYVYCKSTMKYIGGLLNVEVYNRSVGGYTSAQMVTQYTTAIHPIALAGRLKYGLVVCCLNDGALPLSTSQSNLTALYNSYIADGVTPVFATQTPGEMQAQSSSYTPAQESRRQQLNAWIKATFPYVLDWAGVIQDPTDPTSIRRDPRWLGEASGGPPHYGNDARRAIAEYTAKCYVGNPYGLPQVWDFLKPTPYQPVISTTPAYPAPSYIRGLSGTFTGDLPISGGSVTIDNNKGFQTKNASGTVRRIINQFVDNVIYFDNQDGDIHFRTGGGYTSRLFISNSTGIVGINTGTSVAVSGTGKFHASGNTARTTDAARTPASSSEACNIGESAWDATYEYRCTATNTWQRSTRSTF